MTTTYVDNWPGTAHILGPDLMKNMREQVQSFGAEIKRQTIEKVDLTQHPFKIVTKREEFLTHSLIIASGTSHKKLTIPGEQEYWNKGVSTCAVCDGAFYKNKRVLVVGGGDSAMEDASFMTNFTDDITIVHILDKLTASVPMQQRVLKNHHIKIIYESTVSEIKGNGLHVTDVTITHTKTKAEQTLPFDAVFVAIGLKPNTELFKGQLELNNHGYIIHKQYTETSIPGVFAAGDVADSRYRQAITAAGSGCMAALDAERYLKTNGY